MGKSAGGRIMEAYEQMATVARYRPAAPGDGWGSVFLTDAQLSDPCVLGEEARRYAARFLKEDDARTFWIGCSDFRTVRAFVYTIEAAKCLCAGLDGWEQLAVKLLKMAAAEVKRET